MGKVYFAPFGEQTKTQAIYEIRRRLYDNPIFNKADCETELCVWQKCRVVYIPTGQRVFDASFCIPFTQKGATAYVVVHASGFCEFRELFPLSTFSVIRNVFKMYTKGFLLAIGIAKPEQIKPLLSMYEKLPDIIKVSTSKIAQYAKNGIQFYQKSTARIKDSLHIDEIAVLHKISLSLSDEYKTYWIAQESKLSDLSFKIFGDFQTVSSYVHLCEMYFYIQIKNTAGTENEKRLVSLKHGAKIT
ncbi:unnamed protein product, partial [marine sediment metagenome]